jgi:hypothetical protein
MVDGFQVHKVRASQSKSEQVNHCIDLEHFVHWLHLEPTQTHLYYTDYTWSPLTCTTLSALGAHSPTVLLWLDLEPTHLLYYSG